MQDVSFEASATKELPVKSTNRIKKIFFIFCFFWGFLLFFRFSDFTFVPCSLKYTHKKSAVLSAYSLLGVFGVTQTDRMTESPHRAVRASLQYPCQSLSRQTSE